MARANRHHLPGYIWHITHRCHKKEFLLKFKKDKNRWMKWLFEAKKRFGLSVLNYAVTSNHIHLLAFDSKENVIPQSIQRYSLINRQELANLLGIKDEVQLIESSAPKKHLSNCVMSVYDMVDLYTWEARNENKCSHR